WCRRAFSPCSPAGLSSKRPRLATRWRSPHRSLRSAPLRKPLFLSAPFPSLSFPSPPFLSRQPPTEEDDDGHSHPHAVAVSPAQADRSEYSAQRLDGQPQARGGD